MSDAEHPEPEFYEARFIKNTQDKTLEAEIYEGFSYGGNIDETTGFALPYFTKEVSEEIAGNHNFPKLPEHMCIRYDEAKDSYQYSFNGGTFDWEGEDIEIEGMTFHVYPIGHGIFPWGEITKSWIPVIRSQCPYCGWEHPEARDTCDECGHEVSL